jgi:hypothetical protein
MAALECISVHAVKCLIARLDPDDLRASKGITPIIEAWYAFNDIYDSPLKFERKSNLEETNYMEIKRACSALERDFNDDGIIE